jgi:hypothetical protein
MCLLSGGLMGSSPERPGDNVGWLDAFSCEALGYPADFLDRPANEKGRFEERFLGFSGFVFLETPCLPGAGSRPSCNQTLQSHILTANDDEVFSFSERAVAYHVGGS